MRYNFPDCETFDIKIENENNIRLKIKNSTYILGKYMPKLPSIISATTFSAIANVLYDYIAMDDISLSNTSFKNDLNMTCYDLVLELPELDKKLYIFFNYEFTLICYKEHDMYKKIGLSNFLHLQLVKGLTPTEVSNIVNVWRGLYVN